MAAPNLVIKATLDIAWYLEKDVDTPEGSEQVMVARHSLSELDRVASIESALNAKELESARFPRHSIRVMIGDAINRLYVEARAALAEGAIQQGNDEALKQWKIATRAEGEDTCQSGSNSR